jgi:hypothetical protein
MLTFFVAPVTDVIMWAKIMVREIKRHQWCTEEIVVMKKPGAIKPKDQKGFAYQ